MKFTIQTDALAKALRVASVSTMSGRSSLPILGNIKIEASGDSITLSTTNLDIYVIQKVAAEVKKEGATTAPFSILSQLVGQSDSTNVEIAQEKNEIVLTTGYHVARIETLPVEEFPPSVKPESEGVECDAQDLLKPFTLVTHAISEEKTRYALHGVNVSKGGDYLATDGKRIALFKGKEITTDNVTLPTIFVRAMLTIEPSGAVKVFIANGHVTLIAEEVEITSKLIEAAFPESVRKAIPKRRQEAFSCGRKILMNALRRCSIQKELKTPGLNLAGKGKDVEVSNPGKAVESVTGTELAAQPEVTMKLNEKYLLDCLSVLTDENVRIQVTDENSPVLIEEGKFSEVIMPMRVQ